MNNYKCKCGNEKDFFIEHNLSQCGLYCGNCGKWQKWLNKDEERLFKHKQNLVEHDSQIRDEVIQKLLNEFCVGCGYLDGTRCSNKTGCPCQIGQSYVVQICNKVLEQLKGEHNE